MGKGSVLSGDSSPVGVLSFDDDIEGSTSTKFEQYARYGHPLLLVKIAAAETNLRAYPYDGDGLLDGASDSTHVQLDNVTAGLPADCTGLLIHMTAGTAQNIGSTRRITAHAANRQMTLNRALPATAAVGDAYQLMVDCFRFSQLIVKAEMGAASAFATLVPFFFDCARTAAGVLRKAIAFPDRQGSLDALGLQNVLNEVAGSYNARCWGVDINGALGAKIYVAAISSGNVSLWAGGT